MRRDLGSKLGHRERQRELVELRQAAGRRLELTRVALGFHTQQDFAVALGIQPTRYNNWKQGLRFPAPEFLAQIYREYGVSSDWILFGSMAALPSKMAASIRKLMRTERMAHAALLEDA